MLDILHIVNTCTDQPAIDELLSKPVLTDANRYTLLRAIICFQKTLSNPDYDLIDYISTLLPQYSNAFIENFMNRDLDIHTHNNNILCADETRISIQPQNDHSSFTIMRKTKDKYILCVQLPVCKRYLGHYRHKIVLEKDIKDAEELQIVPINNNKWVICFLQQNLYLRATNKGLTVSNTLSVENEFYITICDAPCDYDKFVLGENMFLDGHVNSDIIAENATGSTNTITYKSTNTTQSTVTYEEILGVGKTSSRHLNISPKLGNISIISIGGDTNRTDSTMIKNSNNENNTQSTEYAFTLSKFSRLIRTTQNKKKEIYIVYVEKFTRDIMTITLRKKVSHYVDESFRIEPLQQQRSWINFISFLLCNYNAT